MDESKLVAELISANISVISEIAKGSYKKVDEKLRLKLKAGYSNYLENTKRKYSLAKSFFMRDEPVDLYDYYVDIEIQCRQKKFTKPRVSDLVNFSNRVVISGSGGSGKSVLIRHLFLDSLKMKRFVPIIVELRELNSRDITLKQYLSETLQKYGFCGDDRYTKLALEKEHFIYFLDGYDEVESKIRKRLIDEIKSLASLVGESPIIISSRPDDVFDGIDDFYKFHINPLSLYSATELVEKLPYDEEVKSKFLVALKESLYENHHSFLSNPLLLSIMLLTYGENAEIPSKLSVFYNQAYEALYNRHDARKGGYKRKRETDLDVQDFGNVFSVFCLQTYDKRQFKLPRTDCIEYIKKAKDYYDYDFKADGYLSDLQSAACLLIEDGLDIAFSHRSFQEYFVAVYIAKASNEVQAKLISKYWKNMNSDNVIRLLLEINPVVVERHLLIPQLKKLRTFLGFKRVAGITHMFKYFKHCFDTVTIRENSIRASSRNMEANYNDVVELAVWHCNTYSFKGGNYFDLKREKLISDFEIDHMPFRIDLDKTSYRDSILRELFENHGAFSIQYLNSAFGALAKLEDRNSKQLESLSELLGV